MAALTSLYIGVATVTHKKTSAVGYTIHCFMNEYINDRV